MTLKEYKAKRDFTVTPEPEGEVESSSSHRLFVVQKHDASRLHYDFRLELSGVLKSWAVPKGPSLDPLERRLAVEVEDHPVDYGSFEGSIPEGEYGGGAVLLWDRGRWEEIGDPHKGLKKGHLSFRLHGEKLKGAWSLIRMQHEEGEKANWLLVKKDDEFARPEGDVLKDQPQSILSGRTLEDIRTAPDKTWKAGKAQAIAQAEPPYLPLQPQHPELDPSELPGARPAPPPADIQPLMATLVKEIPTGKEWLHEIKFDGYRFLCHVTEGSVRLITRRGNDWTGRFPTIAQAISRLPVNNGILDGEVVVLDPDGTPNFQALQNALTGPTPDNLYCYLFDLPYFEGYDLRDTPLVERKRLLKRVMDLAPLRGLPLRYSDHIEGQGEAMFQRACTFALEGTVSKLASSPYLSGRNELWVKTKCIKRQEFVIGGFTDPEGTRPGFGALVLGYYDQNGRLIYAGRVGTGFDHQQLAELHETLEELEQEENSFARPPTGAQARGVHYVRPALVAEVEFANWTADGLLRQASFKGLRHDKAPEDVHREKAEALTELQADQARQVSPKRKKQVEKKAQKTKASAKEEVVVSGVTLSNPDRILFPNQEITKRELAEFYASIADRILPHIVNRPLSIVRCPQGRGKKCFYQKHFDDSMPDALESIEIEEQEGETEPYIQIKDLPGLISLVQIGALELHPWGSRVDQLEKPDVMIFDLDPDEGISWQTVVAGAKTVAERLRQLGLESFLKTSGGKGLHVVVPLVRRSDWDEVSRFAAAVAKDLARVEPDKYVATMSKAKRKGKIFIDHFRNSRGATSVAPYSTRARKGAPISTPIGWDELDAVESASQFNLANLSARLESLNSDPWQGYFDLRQSITKDMQAALKVK